MNEKILKYGIRNGKEFHITEVESGLSCNCKCPCCGEDLVAKKGIKDKPQIHFAHRSKITCEHAYETSLHYEAKRIIEKKKQISLPYRKPYFESHNLNKFFSWYSDNNKLGIIESRKYEVTNVVLEKKLHKIVPDIICHISGKPLLVEIAVTSKIKEEKSKKIKEIGLPVIEIDISGLNRVVDEKELELNIMGNPNNKKWYGNKRDEGIIEILQNRHREIQKEIQPLIVSKIISGTKSDPIIGECPLIISKNKAKIIRIYDCKNCQFNLATHKFNILCGYKNYIAIKEIIDKHNKTNH